MSTYVSYCGDRVTAEFTYSDYRDITFIGEGEWFDDHFDWATAVDPTGCYWQVAFVQCEPYFDEEDGYYDPGQDETYVLPCFIGPRPA